MNNILLKYLTKILGADAKFAIDLAALGPVQAMEIHDLSHSDAMAAIRRINAKLADRMLEVMA
jgi:hypothetical protein